MRWRHLLLFLVPLMLIPLAGGAASAGIIFGKKPKKPSPNERVPELLAIVKTDGDESKRAAAAQELRQYDPSAFPQIVPVLVDVLLTDKKPGVRAEAAQSLGKLRPISQQAGMALEQALSSDSSMRVRLQARSSLLQYHWSGYHSPKKDDLLLPQTKEPPLADGSVPMPGSTPPPPNLPPPGRLAPQPAMVPMSGSRLTPPPPAPFPIVPVRQPTNREPPLAPAPIVPAVPTTPVAPSTTDSGPELTPPP